MAAAIRFLAGEDFEINDLAGSGLGFFGAAGFGASVAVGDWNERTFITNGAGSTQGAEVDNVMYLNAQSGVLGQAGSGILLTCIPNHQATLAIEFTYDAPVQVQEAEFRIYDRYHENNPASGVTTKVAEIIHPAIEQTNNGSGDSTWHTPGGSGSVVSLCPSPGPSGLYAGNGSNSTWEDTVHRWHLAISCSPNQIGSKPFAGYFSCEFL